MEEAQDMGDCASLRRRIERLSIPEPNSGCWLWLARVDHDGYAQITTIGNRKRIAHRVSYEAFRESVPTGLQLDHKCRVRCCVNPDHLEPVTNRVNTLRGVGPTAVHAAKTHCPHGHPYEGENLRLYRGQRFCRACSRARKRR